MPLEVIRSDQAAADLRIQADWYYTHADPWQARRYLEAVDATLELLAAHPGLGPVCDYPEEELSDLRRYVVRRPFQRHIVFYRIEATVLRAVRVLTGERDLPRRLLEPPGAD